MNTILRKQFLAHVGQTSPSPMLVEVAHTVYLSCWINRFETA